MGKQMNDRIFNDKPVPIILGGGINGLGLVRSFGYVGMPVICLDKEKSLCFYSKYTTSYLCPDPKSSEEELIDYLLDFGQKLPHKGVIFASGDEWLVVISKNRQKLSKFYLFPMSEWNIIKNCWNKRKLYEIAQKNGIPCAKTFYIDNISKIDSIIGDVTFPCILKPVADVGFQDKLGSIGATIPIKDYEQLVYWEKKILKKNLGETPLIVQEIIVGPITNLYTITSYSNSSADIVAYSIGHKIRQFPPKAGTIVCGQVKNDQEVFELGEKVIKILKYYGIANTEFKKDERDNKFKLVEINPRSGMWNYSVLMSGINLPYRAYLDLLGEPYKIIEEKEEGKIWVILLQDLLYSILYNRILGYKEFSINIGEWYKSTRGKKIYAVESWNDPIPGVVYNLQFFLRALTGLKKYLKKS